MGGLAACAVERHVVPIKAQGAGRVGWVRQRGLWAGVKYGAGEAFDGFHGDVAFVGRCVARMRICSTFEKSSNRRSTVNSSGTRKRRRVAQAALLACTVNNCPRMFATSKRGASSGGNNARNWSVHDARISVRFTNLAS